MEDLIMDQRFAGVDELVHRKDCLERIFHSIHLLDEQEAEILRMRFGLSGDEAMGIVDTARRLCITRDRARYLEKKAIERLRTLSRGGRF
jgi:DNA-directed RNA polymerase sigma subunit (sigma70/sigma32)